MEKITVDEQNKKRIQKYIKQATGLLFGYEEDIALLEQNNELTESFARKVFTDIMNDAQRIRGILTAKEKDEFKELIEETYFKYDSIPKPERLEEYGFNDGSYRNMELEDVYSNMQIAFEVKELDSKYYGCRDLRNIADSVINSINGIEKYKIELQPEAKEELQRIQEELKTLLSADRTDMQGIQARVDKYNEHAIHIWNDYITNVNDKENEEFRYVVHNFTSGEIQEDFRTKYMSTSLVTNNTMGLYGSSKVGFIIRPKHIISASDKDTYTYNYREDGEEIYNIKPPLKLPQEIEDSCVQQTIETNGEILNYDKESIYSEIVVDEYEIIGVYCIDNGEKELSPNYERAIKIAQERGLPLREIDISKYRMDKGLEAIPEVKRKQFCENLFKRLYSQNELFKDFYINGGRMFSNKYYQQFYEKYMAEKEIKDFSVEDILKIVVELSEKDEQFESIISDLRKYCIEKDNVKQDSKYETEPQVDDKAKQEEILNQKTIENTKVKKEEYAKIKLEQDIKVRTEESAKIKAEQEVKIQEEIQARLSEKKKEEERHSNIEKEWREYQDYEDLITTKPELRELVENLKYEHFSAEVYGQYSPKMKALEEIVKELPENEKRIVMQEYKRFTELGNNENKGFEINEQGEILRDSKVQEIYQPEKVKKREENIRDTVENDIRKETEKHQQSFEEEILEKKGILKLGYQGVELDESDLNKVHDIINKTKNKSQIEQTYEKEQ